MENKIPTFEYLGKTFDNFNSEIVNVVQCVKCSSILREPNADDHICAQKVKGGKQNAKSKNKSKSK